MTEPFPVSPPPSSGKTQLMIAAIILIVCASISWIYSAIDVAVRFFNLSHNIRPGNLTTPAAQTGFYAAMYGMIAIGILTFLLAPVIVFGAIQMLRQRMYRFCRTTAILAMLPISTNCCCIITLPIGIWLIVILGRIDVQSLFAERASQ